MSENAKRPRTLPHRAVQLAVEWPEHAEDKFALLFALNFECEQGVVMLQDPKMPPGVLKVIGTHGLSTAQLHLAGLLRVDVKAEDLARMAHQYGVVRLVYTHKAEHLGQTEKLIKDAFDVGTLMCCSVVMPDGTLGLIYACSQERKSPRPHQSLQAVQIANSLTLGLHRHVIQQAQQVMARTLQLMLEHTSDLLMVHHHGVIQQVNARAWREGLGLTPQDVVGRQYPEMTHPDDLEQGHQQTLQHPTPAMHNHPVLVRMRHKQGHWVPMEWHWSSLDDGTFVGTGKVLSEPPDAPLAAVPLEQAAPMFWTLNPQGMQQFSPTYLDYLGIQLQDGQSMDWFGLLHPDDQQGCMDLFTTLLQHQQTFVNTLRIRTRDETYRWIQVTGTPLFSEQGVFGGYSGVALDIHDHQMNVQQHLESVPLN